jgi:hypothetical protein
LIALGISIGLGAVFLELVNLKQIHMAAFVIYAGRAIANMPATLASTPELRDMYGQPLRGVDM